MFMGVDPAAGFQQARFQGVCVTTRHVFFGRKTKRQQALANQRNVDSSLIAYA